MDGEDEDEKEEDTDDEDELEMINEGGMEEDDICSCCFPLNMTIGIPNAPSPLTGMKQFA